MSSDVEAGGAGPSAASRRGALVAGRYRIEKPIAAGGMGEVWQGIDEVLGRTVSVKFLHPQFASDENFLERMLREARAASAVNHPGVVAVYDFGRIDPDDGLTMSYIVMELVDGPSLSQIMLEDPPPVEQTLKILQQTAAALHAAHQAGVVHRDVKPGNILLAPNGSVKLTDFGIARSHDASTITESGSITGTAHYLSPEQAAGETATERSDLYSLGVVIYSLLNGAVPFDRDGPVAIALAHIQDAPPPLPPEIPSLVADLVMSLLEKDPDARPRDAAAVAEQAALLLGGGSPTELVAPVGAGIDPEATAVTTVNPDLSGATVVSPAQDEAEERRRRSKRPLILVAAALAVLGLVAAFLLFGRGGEQVAMPSLVGMSRADAEAELDDLGLDAKVEVKDVAKTKADEVVEQSEKEGAELEVGTEVTLTVASGKVELPVEELVGASYKKARAILEDLGLRAKRVTKPAPEDSGTVLDVRGNKTRVDVGSTVALVVAVAEAPVPAPTSSPKPRPKPTPTPTTEPTGADGAAVDGTTADGATADGAETDSADADAGAETDGAGTTVDGATTG
ncbi:MAG: protein kinase domain-containing protein [Aeromicrobium sp.]